ncbi:MAG: general secretion pathway protein GspK [Verrucomicrobiota bacterium]|nr:general secretion pathway protein GspK [Verrucomicrobiota bacterium]
MRPAFSQTLSRPASGGFALIIAMIAITVLGVLAAGFAFSMKVETRLAIKAKSDPQLLWLGRAGVELARWALVQQTTIPGEPYDSLNQLWAGGPGGLGETNSPLQGVPLNHFPVGDGWLSIRIIDLERFANINTAPPQMLQQALNLMGVNAEDISVVSDSIQDWIQPGDNPRAAGAKSDYYQGLDPPYYCKDAPMDDLSELLLVRGVTPAMYYGTGETHPDGVALPKLGLGNAPFQAPDYPFGLKDLFTTLSTGRININTAGTNVLQLLPGVDGQIAEAIVRQRAGPDGMDGTDDDTPFQSPGQLATAGIPPPIVGEMSRFCTTRSATFKVFITAHCNGFSRDFTAILFRPGGPDVRVLSFYWK